MFTKCHRIRDIDCAHVFIMWTVNILTDCFYYLETVLNAVEQKGKNCLLLFFIQLGMRFIYTLSDRIGTISKCKKK